MEARRVTKDDVQIRRYFMTTISNLRRHARENDSQMGDILVRMFMQLDSAQHVWVVEFAAMSNGTLVRWRYEQSLMQPLVNRIQ